MPPNWGSLGNPSLLMSLVCYTTVSLFWTPPFTHTHTWSRVFNIFNISAERSTFWENCRSFRANVKYAEFWGPMLNQNVLLSAETLNMLNAWGKLEGDPWPENSTYSTFQQKETHFRKNVILSGEMLIMSERSKFS